MDIVLTWDSSVTDLPAPQQAAFEAAVTYAAEFFERTLTSPVTVTLNVGWGEITDGGSPTTLSAGTSEGGPGQGYYYTYAQVQSALQSHETSPATVSAFNDLPSTDPSGGQGFYLSFQEAMAIGLPVYGNEGDATGSVGFGEPVSYDTYNYSTSDRAVANEADFVGIAEHEIAHALGRDSSVGSGSQLDVLDLFRFASAGVLATSATQTSYFSVDGGQTALNYFDATNTDPADWTAAGPNASSNDAFDLQYGIGTEDYVTATDVKVMNALGYSINPDSARDDFSGDEYSDILIQNSSGSVVTGALNAGGQLAYDTVGSLGAAWSFVGTGDYLGLGTSQFLIKNTNGSVDVGAMVNGAVSYSRVAGLGAEWSFQGTGDFLGVGYDQFLIENSAGWVDVGEVINGAAHYTKVAALGSEWKFVGIGDFLGDDQDQFLIQNTNGALDIGEVANGHAGYTAVGALGSQWRFVATGDFSGDGKAQALIENANGALDLAEVVNGVETYSNVGALTSAWTFVGVGDFQGSGMDSFLIRNVNGSVDTGTLVDGSAQYARIGGLGAEWKFHG